MWKLCNCSIKRMRNTIKSIFKSDLVLILCLFSLLFYSQTKSDVVMSRQGTSKISCHKSYKALLLYSENDLLIYVMFCELFNVVHNMLFLTI